MAAAWLLGSSRLCHHIHHWLSYNDKSSGSLSELFIPPPCLPCEQLLPPFVWNTLLVCICTLMDGSHSPSFYRDTWQFCRHLCIYSLVGLELRWCLALQLLLCHCHHTKPTQTSRCKLCACVEDHVARQARKFCMASVYHWYKCAILATSCLLYTDTVSLNDRIRDTSRGCSFDVHSPRTKATSELCFATSCWTLCTQWALKESITKRAFFVLSVAKPHFLIQRPMRAYNYQAYISYTVAAAAVSHKNLQDTISGAQPHLLPIPPQLCQDWLLLTQMPNWLLRTRMPNWLVLIRMPTWLSQWVC